MSNFDNFNPATGLPMTTGNPCGTSESLRFQDAKRDHPGQPLRLQARPSFRPEPSGLGGAPEPPDGRLRCITSTMTRRGVAMAFQGYLARCHSLDRTETPLPLLGTTRPALRAPWLAADVAGNPYGVDNNVYHNPWGCPNRAGQRHQPPSLPPDVSWLGAGTAKNVFPLAALDTTLPSQPL